MEKPKNRIWVRVLIGLGTLLTVLAIFSVWADRQALDTDEWVTTSDRLLEDEDIQVALSAYLTNELFENVDVEQALAAKLPPRAQPLAAPIAGALRQAAGTAAQRLLASPKVQEAWETANRTAHGELLDVIDDKGQYSSTGGGDVVLELKPLVEDMADQLGISADVADRLPPDVASLVIVRSDEVDAAQTVAKLLKGLSVVLIVLALLCFALAIFLAEGRRPSTVIWCGVGLVFAGVAVLALRHIGGQSLIDSLVVNHSNEAAGDSVWTIGTSLLRSISITAIAYGVLFIVAGWLATATGSARWARKQLAPALRDHSAVLYGGIVAVALIYFAFAPTHGLRAILTLLILAGLAVLGLTALREQTTKEFPA